MDCNVLSHCRVTLNGMISLCRYLGKKGIAERLLKSVDVGNLYKCHVIP
jgi:hypothetical protein